MKLLFKNSLFYLLLIFVVAAFLRFYQIGVNPPSLTWDEVAWGYNAYSLGLDGKDEFGIQYPLAYLESFGDFKPPVYAYLDILPVKFLGLNAFATRFPSALFGTLTVLITYFLTKRILSGDKYDGKGSETVALLAAGILAISPWHIMLSRAAFEANVSTFFIATGVWLFLMAIQSNKNYLMLSAVSFVLSIYTFNTARVFVPLLLLALAFLLRKKLFEMKREVITSALLGLLLLLPTIGFLLSPQASLRFREVNIFTDPQVVKTSNTNVEIDNNAIWSKLLNNRRVFFGISFVNHYFDNLNPLFLFTRGDGNPKFSIQSVGQMYMWESVFLVAGLLFLFSRRQGYWWIVPVWVLLGIIPAATARETPHALRIETTLPMFQILVAYGLVSLSGMISDFKVLKYSLLKLSACVLVLIAVFNFLYFYHDLMNHYPYLYSGEWQYGYEDALKYASKVEDNYDRINFTNELGRPYIYYLFYNNISPDKFRTDSTVKRDAFGFVKVDRVGKYYFPEMFEYSKEDADKTLYIGTPYEMPEGAHVLKTFKLLNGRDVLVAYTI